MKRPVVLFLGAYALFVAAATLAGVEAGVAVGRNFLAFGLDMLKVLPCAFLLIGLFEVWVSRETVERYLGQSSGVRGWLGCILLAGTAAGGAYVAFPIAHALYRKGASLSNVFLYVSAAAIARLPMTAFEASFLGLKFTLVRWLVSLPLVVFSSIFLGRLLERSGYRLPAAADESAA